MMNRKLGLELITEPLIDGLRSAPCIPGKHHHFSHVVQQVTLDGLYLEFGVFKGDSINCIADLIAPRQIYGFDSFMGLPEDWVRRRDGSLTLPAGTFAVEELPELHANATLIKGFFAETLPSFIQSHPEDIAFINIDSDVYSSAKTVLDQLNEQIVPGSILYFDEITGWGDLIMDYDTWEDGEYRALLEWMDEFDRSVEPVSRNDRYGAAVRVLL